MANLPMIDLSTLDLTQVAVTAEEVGRINPQCGAMRQCDHVIWMEDDQSSAVGVKQVTEDEFWVPLHIPGRPLMPGVLMIEACAQLSSVQFRLRSRETRFVGFTRCDGTVFRGQVVPGDTLYLLSREVVYHPRRFVSAVQGVVNGKVVVESKISGMVLRDERVVDAEALRGVRAE